MTGQPAVSASQRAIHLLPLLVVLALAAVFAFYMLAGFNPRELPSTLVDRPAPAITLAPLDGRDAGDPAPLAIAELRGEVVLVNFFASWCVPCLAEHPVLTRLARDGLTIHGIANRDKPGDSRAWLARHGDPYARIGVDLENRAGIEWGVTGVPETFILDTQGRVRFRFAGPITPSILESTIQPVLDQLAAEQAT